MNIRKSTINDLDEILDIYAYAREYMKKTGNPNQWKDYWPTSDIIKEDINNQNSYVVVNDENQICGVFAFIIGDDNNYKIIEGKWLNDNVYGTIHRLASNGKCKDILKTCLEFCEKQINNIRIDTHEDNLIMQHLLEKYDFIKCGIIYVEDKTPRIAYQKVIS